MVGSEAYRYGNFRWYVFDSHHGRGVGNKNGHVTRTGRLCCAGHGRGDNSSELSSKMRGLRESGLLKVKCASLSDI